MTIKSMWQDEDGSVTGYMCMTDFDCELGIASDGVHIFPSKEDCAMYRPCTAECGIVEVKITGLCVVQKPVDYHNIKADD